MKKKNSLKINKKNISVEYTYTIYINYITRGEFGLF